MTNCIFCKIASGEISADKILETDHIVAFQDISPQAPTHVLVIPKRHIANILEIDPNSDGDILKHLVAGVQEVAEKCNLKADGFRVVTNTGSFGGQTVDHIHFHLLGGRPLTWPPG